MATSNEAAAAAAPTRSYVLESEHELRIETLVESSVTLKVLRGAAELFGTELAQQRAYTIGGGSSVAVFSWRGATVELSGRAAVAYLSNETPMVQLANVHAQLQRLRRPGRRGPRVLVVGAADAGKSSVARTLLSYAVRAGAKPMFADVDVALNDIAVPGCVAATPVRHPVDAELGLRFRVPLAYFFGHTEPVENKAHYEACVAALAAAMERRALKHPDELAGGFVVNTGGWVDGDGYRLLLAMVPLFAADVVLVCGHDRLHAQLVQEPGLAGVHVTKLPKSGGVMPRDAAAKRRARHARIKAYFYGPAADLSPHKSVLWFDDIAVFEVGGMPQAPSSALPIGESRLLQPNRVVPVTPSVAFLHSVLAVSQATKPEDLLTAPAAGFVYVSAVDVHKRCLTVLAPCPGPLPARCLLHGSLMWFD